MTAHDDLAEDERIIAAATAGPWEDGERYGAVVTRAFPTTPGEASEAYGGVPICESAKKPDRAFIARSRTRWPALVEEVRELKAMILGFGFHAENCPILGCNCGFEEGRARHEEGA